MENDPRPGGSDDELGGLRTEHVTALLVELRAGDASASGRLFALLYPELRRMAGAIFARQHPAHTLQPTALVHEVCLKLTGRLGSIEDRRHFLVVAGAAMRQILADHARARLAAKRHGDGRRVTLAEVGAGGDGQQVDLVTLDECLRLLEQLNARHARVVELRVFAGLSIDEIAGELAVSPRTVDLDWAMAKAWLRARLA